MTSPNYSQNDRKDPSDCCHVKIPLRLEREDRQRMFLNCACFLITQLFLTYIDMLYIKLKLSILAIYWCQ